MQFFLRENELLIKNTKIFIFIRLYFKIFLLMIKWYQILMEFKAHNLTHSLLYEF